MYVGDGSSENNNLKTVESYRYAMSNFLRGSQNNILDKRQNLYQPQSRQGGISWPFAGYFPIVINDPFLSVYNAFTSSMYNAVSSMVEYGPEADICLKNKESKNFKTELKQEEIQYKNRGHSVVEKVSSAGKPITFSKEKPLSVISSSRIYEENVDASDTNVFSEIIMRTENKKNDSINSRNIRNIRSKLHLSNEKEVTQKIRSKRDSTSVFLKTRQNDKIGITVQEPVSAKDAFSSSYDERGRSFSPTLVNPPPLSTILRPPHQGYADKKRKAKPSKPIKEEGSSEEIGEEHEEENSSQMQENINEAVAISPPPEGASVAEAKPIGLAIAGPGGVAASKPQGTAVAGPGGLAIARPVGTAIAGVEVEGSVPIGGQQKNKKKPKQEAEQTEGELHYVGGLTGPIGNPQPKEFADDVYYKSVKEAVENNIQDNVFFRGRQNTNGYQLKLGQQIDGKYGFVPTFSSSVQGSDRLQKRMDSPTYFHGLLGSSDQGVEQFQNYQMQY